MGWLLLKSLDVFYLLKRLINVCTKTRFIGLVKRGVSLVRCDMNVMTWKRLGNLTHITCSLSHIHPFIEPSHLSRGTAALLFRGVSQHIYHIYSIC